MPEPKNDFEQWNKIKQQLNASERTTYIHEGDVWFCSIGKNIGHEQDGKNYYYERPVLIVCRFTADYFWGIPITSSARTGPYSMEIEFAGIKRVALLFHLRSYDRKRLGRRMGCIGCKQLETIRARLATLLTKQKTPLLGS